jgi:drug/metabolite transporter (DMT)-like permease
MPPAQASVIMSAEGMFGMIFSLLLGLESFRWRMLAGGLLVTLSVILVSLAPQEETEKS